MNEHCDPRPVVWEKLQAGLLAPHLKAVSRELSERGYAITSSNYALRLFAALGAWLEPSSHTVLDLNEAILDAFLAERYQTHQPHRQDRAMLAFFLACLRRTGVLVPRPECPDLHPTAPIREAFRAHLINQRNLAPETVSTYLDTVTRFLDWRFGVQSPPVLSALSAEDVNAFMLEQARRYGAGHTQLIASALRGFLRFLLQYGILAIDLAQAVPAPARRQLAGLPKFMPPEDVERLLASVDQTRPQGLRDEAILLLLARLGLRAGEVARLRLDDLDWEAREPVIRGKCARVERLPLPWDVGEALSRYLREARPACITRQVFVCLRAPRRGFQAGNAVGTIVRRALARADLHPPHQGAHLLRHSLPTRLLREGASLVEIGELLRHHNLDTTRIYAKVDEPSLRRLAPPWPGGAQ
ncbi:tyrosine-type recombinase/integrase [Thiorhodococcus mannitoliphagus]|uniref:Tyrosine-type recombinase/integrase n=1 Tax=Thiorhodococcus mannitoliphagus TaxID=329406 RepID=A0A6P1DS64_9GAMM|nr:tyrosine-type recombinase/integrase [Thiorhodococcus mannitoliphagus]NEX20679.1 tyrosine-type recombinase/integrase [Thiorhodococcus mannitoliphagus]